MPGITAPALVAPLAGIPAPAQAQRHSGKAWSKTGTLTATVYFDADGAAPNKAVRTFKSGSTGYLKTTFPATTSENGRSDGPSRAVLQQRPVDRNT
ncbi:hypothetical protein [Arthrobacter sp. H35-D1]|uniref:hypothetical protein n=1 Tax=Arthrobacter sp. H35-D1 TaxID=3046202 RepID=UPI0024BB300F|nr:hypothetical protein [Arthrobacter sp. H35-D1]MDJ0312835.1 hypothetical protein [Arthrobacter sp. H35-D1]